MSNYRSRVAINGIMIIIFEFALKKKKKKTLMIFKYELVWGQINSLYMSVTCQIAETLMITVAYTKIHISKNGF